MNYNKGFNYSNFTQDPQYIEYMRQMSLQQGIHHNMNINPNIPVPLTFSYRVLQPAFDIDNEKNVEKEIVIFKLSEPSGKGIDYKLADSNTVQQILSAIGVPLNITGMTRLGKFTPTKPRRIVVQFSSKKIKRLAVQNAHNLKHFPQWQHLSLKPYQPRKEETESHSESNHKVSSKPSKSLKPQSSSSLSNPFIKFASKDESIILEEINILVIGATGVGKSTWINGIANYMSFDTFDDALSSNKPLCLIPMKFSVAQKEVKMEVNVRATDGNEGKFITGQSCTQKPKVYRYVSDMYAFNLIDTPGIGDTRGVEYDIENMKMIIDCLSKWEKIHGICLLLKSDEPRLVDPLCYCINELLLNLHKSSIPNISVVFTNACTTLYRTGNTLTLLKSHFEKVKQESQNVIPLSSANVFCIDNEAIKLVYAQHHGIDYGEIDVESSSCSWEHTVNETYRLFEYVAGLTPHSANETKATSQVRQTLTELFTIMTVINDKTTQNKKLHDEQTKQLKFLETNLSQIRNSSYQGEYLEKIALTYPVTVCCGPNCSEPIRSPNSNIVESFYNKICCKSCHLSNVTREVMGEINLRQCTIFDQNAICRTCGCQWQAHQHIWYSQRKATKQFSIADKQQECDRLKLQIAAKLKYIQELQATTDKFEQAYKEVESLAEPYYEFLLQNSIIIINRAYGVYLEISMKVLNDSFKIEEDQSELKNLQKLYAIYQAQKAFVDSHPKTAVFNSTKEKSDTLNYSQKITELKDHKVVGSMLQDSNNYQRLFKIQPEYDLVRCSTKNKLSSNH
jgi:predicted GTPase